MIKTCGTCDQMEMTLVHMGAGVGSCKMTGAVVPQSMDGAAETITFWRVPMECPLYTGSKKQAPKKDWVTKTFEEVAV